jgi:hypothetical protein
VVALLAVLLTITALPAATQPAADRPAADRAPAQQSAANPARPPSRPPANPTSTPAGRAGDGCPPVKRVHAWLACLWRQANPPEPNKEQGRAMPLPPAPPTWRSRS